MKLRVRAHHLAVLCSLLAASSLAGCGGGNETAPVAASSSPAPAATPAPAPTPTAPAADSGESVDGGGGPGYSGPVTDPASSGESMPNSGMADSSGMGGMGMPTPIAEPSDPADSYGASYGSGMGMGTSSPNTGLNSLMGMGMAGNAQRGPVDPAPAEDDDYMTKAKYAFAIGKEAAAEQYFYAHLLAHEEEAPALLQQVRWSPGERKPTTTVRFAVGVDLKAPTGIEDYRPIGRTGLAGNNAAGSGGSGMATGYGMDSAGSGQPGGQGNKAEKTLGDLTGRFGEELVTTFEKAWDNGDFGTAFKDVDVIQPVKAGQPNTGDPYGMGMSSMGMSSSMSSGAEGMGYGPPSNETADGAAKPADAALRMRAVPGKVVVPGLLYVGTGSAAELEEKAQQEGIDFLFLFEVNVKPARGMVHNDTRLRLVSTKDNSAIGATSTLNNLKVDVAMARKSETDDVAKQLGNLFRKVETLKLSDLPKLEPVHAQARIKSLLAKTEKDKLLATLMEIRLFNSMGLLNEEERNAAYELALGGAGIALASGTLEDRQFVLDPLLPSYK